MATVDFTLALDGRSFPIPKQSLVDFFELHPSLFDESAYQVRSPVTVEDFGDFVNYLKSKQLPEITTANAKPLYLLSQEFGVFGLSSRCDQLLADLQTVDSPLMSACAELKANYWSQTTAFESFRRSFPFCLSDSLSSRLEQIERDLAQFRGDFETRLTFCSSNCDELRSTIPLEVSKLESRLESDLSDHKSTCNQFRNDIDALTMIPRLFPLHPTDPLNGIICELTRKHDGNGHDKGIV
jgi:hypothetical protein